MTLIDDILDRGGHLMAQRLDEPGRGRSSFPPPDPGALRETLRPADVLLVDGAGKISAAIKYLTQSTWSHAALYVGDLPGLAGTGPEACCLIEANVGEGVIAAPLSKYASRNTRICRPVGLNAGEVLQVTRFAIERIGVRYDMRNIIDLARYFFPTPPVPSRWRRRMIALGSGEPTRVICSTLIAEAFQSVRYPILPNVEQRLVCPGGDGPCDFEVVKPTLANGFDHHRLRWGSAGGGDPQQTRIE
jgi:hypothetical protein